jgi:hypothetical protein
MRPMNRLGHTEQAQAALTSLRQAMKAPRWAKSERLQAFLREAEALLQVQAPKPGK